MDDFEWKLREVEQSCKRRLEEKDKALEERLKEGRKELELKLKLAEKQLLEVNAACHPSKVKVKHSRYRPCRPRGFSEVKASRFLGSGTVWW